eukprot:TRINITY_DN733_c0_g1_i1.p1 TRINITY_DN733_c0_g1~~TRINITY_DN733_c0_g1_i1.p1  ORF type:complete len:241 (+),score=66.61 TRINITY_DN733_c0_g1_i1:193-915(+)
MIIWIFFCFLMVQAKNVKIRSSSRKLSRKFPIKDVTKKKEFVQSDIFSIVEGNVENLRQCHIIENIKPVLSESLPLVRVIDGKVLKIENEFVYKELVFNNSSFQKVYEYLYAKLNESQLENLNDEKEKKIFVAVLQDTNELVAAVLVENINEAYNVKYNSNVIRKMEIERDVELGVSHLFTEVPFRRKGLATNCLNLALVHFFKHKNIMKSQVAMSSPTRLGNSFSKGFWGVDFKAYDPF